MTISAAAGPWSVANLLAQTRRLPQASRQTYDGKMNLVFRISTLLTLILLSQAARAREVSFLGGTSLMSLNRPDWSDVMVNQTFWPRAALGAEYRVYRENTAGTSGKRQFALLTASALAMRLNEDSAQTNLYLTLGAGFDQSSAATRGAGYGAIEADRETRQFYGNAHFETLGFDQTKALELLRLRLGFAPYLAEMDGIHTWILLQSESESRNGITDFSPLIRLTYVNTLFEIGCSFNGLWQFNWTVEI